jgi:hypothetical protein
VTSNSFFDKYNSEKTIENVYLTGSLNLPTKSEHCCLKT